VAVAALLVAGALGWAAVRGLDSYQTSLAGIGYDLDQPPILLALVGIWIFCRSRAA
jgi:hypothetical protein